MSTTAPTWRCGHPCLTDVTDLYRAVRLCPECRLMAEDRQPVPGVAFAEEVQSTIWRPPSPREREWRRRLEDLASKILIASVTVQGIAVTDTATRRAESAVDLAEQLLAAVDSAEMPEQGG